MKMFIIAWSFGLLLMTQAFAQQPPPDPVFMQRALSVIQTQRNQALDAAAVNEAKVAGLVDDLAKAQARIKELEGKSKEEK